MPYGPTPVSTEDFEVARKEEIRSKKKELFALNNHELSDLLRQHLEREDILASKKKAFDKTFRGKLTTGLLLAFPSTLLIGGILESLIRPKAEDAGRYTVYAGLAVYTSLMIAGWKMPIDPEVDTWAAGIRKYAMIELYTERHKIESKYVRSHLYKGK